jgi:hypothetical protein
MSNLPKKLSVSSGFSAFGILCVIALVAWNRPVLAGVRVVGEVPSEVAPATPAPKLVVYANGMSSSPYAPSGWMGNQAAIKLDDKCSTKPHDGETCMKLEYRAVDQWGGVIWQDPPNDWGDKPGGFNLTGATKLAFWARGETGGEKVKFLFGVIKREKPHFDTAFGELEVTLTMNWAEYSIDLTGKDLERIKTGFGWTLGGQGKPVTFFLDDIKYE